MNISRQLDTDYNPSVIMFHSKKNNNKKTSNQPNKQTKNKKTVPVCIQPCPKACDRSSSGSLRLGLIIPLCGGGFLSGVVHGLEHSIPHMPNNHRATLRPVAEGLFQCDIQRKTEHEPDCRATGSMCTSTSFINQHTKFEFSSVQVQ